MAENDGKLFSGKFFVDNYLELVVFKRLLQSTFEEHENDWLCNMTKNLFN